MPHHCRRTESKYTAVLLNSPTEIHIIASHAIRRVTATDIEQHVSSEGHVATRYVFGNAIREQNMNRSTWRVCDTVSNPTVVRWWYVWPAHSGECSSHERLSEV